MKKFRFLVEHGLKKRVFRKAFLFANIAIGLLLIAVINIPTIIGLFGSEEEEQKNVNVLIINETDGANVSEKLGQLLNEPFEGYEYFVLSEIQINDFDVDAFWEDADFDTAIHLSGDFESPTIDIYNKQMQLNAMLASQIELLIISEQIEGFQRPTFNMNAAPDYEDPDMAAAMSSIISLLSLPLFILITMATQFVGVDIIEEKSTKAIETIIASVPAKIHFLSKITASLIFIIIQSMLLIVYSTIATLISGATQNAGMDLPMDQASLLSFLAEIIPNWQVTLLMTLLFMVAGTLLFLVIAALFASMATTQEDYQQFQTPLMLLLVGGFYIGIFAPMFGGDMFMKIMAFVPLFTPIVGPIALATGVITAFEAVLALLVLIATMLLIMYLVAPIYRVAILSYEQTKFFKRIKGYLSKAFTKNGNGK
jgi:ABC-2 type transport system permease protein